MQSPTTSSHSLLNHPSSSTGCLLMEDDVWWQQQHSCAETTATAETADSSTKRVSLDSTETWMSHEEEVASPPPDDQADSFLLSHDDENPFDDIPSPERDTLFLPDIFLPPPPSPDHAMNSLGERDWMSQLLTPETATAAPVSAAGAHSQNCTPPSMDHAEWKNDLLWHERRRQLAASMERSQQSRAWIEAHIERRANLKRVLADISASTVQVATLLQQQEHPQRAVVVSSSSSTHSASSMDTTTTNPSSIPSSSSSSIPPPYSTPPSFQPPRPSTKVAATATTDPMTY